MERAIVAGASGFVGSAVVRMLLGKGVNVVALGRKLFENTELSLLNSEPELTYFQIDNSQMDELPERLSSVDWDVGGACVFYNFSWSGGESLTSGVVEDQINNVFSSVAMVKVASKLGCKKFVSVGTQEEKFMDDYLVEGWKKRSYSSSHDIYALAKISSRDQTKLAAYLNRIDFIHTRFSVPIDEALNGDGYVNSTLRKIYSNDEYTPPINKQFFDFIPLNELARAYYLIGMRAENRAEYFIGTGTARTLGEYFSRFSDIVGGRSVCDSHPDTSVHDFEIKQITDEIGFKVQYNFDDIAIKLERS